MPSSILKDLVSLRSICLVFAIVNVSCLKELWPNEHHHVLKTQGMLPDGYAVPDVLVIYC